MKCFWRGKPALRGLTRVTVPYLQDNSCFHFLCLCGVAAYRPASGDAEDCLVRLSFQRPDKEEQAKAEIRFMKRLASVMTVPDHCVVGRSVVTHLTSTRLRDVMLYNKGYEPSLYGKIKDYRILISFIPAKDHADNGSRCICFATGLGKSS